MPTFDEVKQILDIAITNWTTKNGGDPDLTRHGPTFSWQTKVALLAAVGHGKRLIQPELIGTGQGDQTNLVLDLSVGLPLRMPKGGPFVSDGDVQTIVAWVNAGCPD